MKLYSYAIWHTDGGLTDTPVSTKLCGEDEADAPGIEDARPEDIARALLNAFAPPGWRLEHAFWQSFPDMCGSESFTSQHLVICWTRPSIHDARGRVFCVGHAAYDGMPV